MAVNDRSSLQERESFSCVVELVVNQKTREERVYAKGSVIATDSKIVTVGDSVTTRRGKDNREGGLDIVLRHAEGKNCIITAEAKVIANAFGGQQWFVCYIDEQTIEITPTTPVVEPVNEVAHKILVSASRKVLDPQAYASEMIAKNRNYNPFSDQSKEQYSQDTAKYQRERYDRGAKWLADRYQAESFTVTIELNAFLDQPVEEEADSLLLPAPLKNGHTIGDSPAGEILRILQEAAPTTDKVDGASAQPARKSRSKAGASTTTTTKE